MNKLPSVILFLAAILSASGCFGARTGTVGIIKSVVGEVFLVGAEQSTKAEPNMKIAHGDVIKTGPSSSAGLIFLDDTAVSLGSNSEIFVDSFLFNPADRELSFVTRLIKGTFCFLTGQIARLAPENVKIETPDATLGVRGTKFLVKID